MAREAIAIDFGATWTRMAVVTRSGGIREMRRWKTPKSRKEIKDEIVRHVLEFHRLGVDRKAAVGIAAIGLLSVEKGRIVMAPNLGQMSINIVEMVKSVHRGDVVLINDCNAAAMAEKEYGVGRKYGDLVYVTISTGIGGGAIIDNRLLLGKDGNAAEIGHLVVDYESPIRCGCGGYGHWEALCSGVGLVKLARHIVGRLVWRSSSDLLDDYLRGRRQASAVIDEAAKINAAGFASVFNAYDPEVVTVGGSLGLYRDGLLVRMASKELKRFETVKAKLIPTPLGANAPLLGAAVAAFNPELAIP
ncbi:Glucokinase [archaeon HR01]|nr:Glucokinase [archaeon HR01]